MSIKLTINGATITIDQTDGNTTIGVDIAKEPNIEDDVATSFPEGSYYKPRAQTDPAIVPNGGDYNGPASPVGSVGPGFNPEQLGKLREVIRAVGYGLLDLGPSDGSVEDRLRRDRKLQEKYHLEKGALGCLRRLVGDTFYDKTLKDFKI